MYDIVNAVKVIKMALIFIRALDISVPKRTSRNRTTGSKTRKNDAGKMWLQCSIGTLDSTRLKIAKVCSAQPSCTQLCQIRELAPKNFQAPSTRIHFSTMQDSGQYGTTRHWMSWLRNESEPLSVVNNTRHNVTQHCCPSLIGVQNSVRPALEFAPG